MNNFRCINLIISILLLFVVNIDGQNNALKDGDNGLNCIVVKRSSLQNLSFSFNQLTGNLDSRTDFRKGKIETFAEYDNLNRLKKMQVTGLSLYTTTYDNIGNITTKNDAAGTYVYDPTRIHAVANVTNPNTTISAMTQNVTYTPYHQPQTITENGYELTYTYAADYERIKGVLKQTVNTTTNTLNTRCWSLDSKRWLT